MKAFGKKTVIGFIAGILVSFSVTGFSAESYIIGTVEKKGDDVILFTPDDTYVLKGRDILPDMVGKKVIVTGAVEVKDQEKEITVTDLKEINEQ
jgi:hypothetical protein